jgi:hypothetical protein
MTASDGGGTTNLLKLFLSSWEPLHRFLHFVSSAVNRIFASLLSWFSCSAR